MLDDRSYMRSGSYGPYRSVTIWLLITNVIIFVLWSAFEFYGSREVVRTANQLVELSPGGLAKGYVWQLLTFQFFHANLLHLLLNLFVIYMFGRPLEESLGKGVFLRLYLLSGALGGLMQCFMGVLVPAYFGYPVVGASAGGFGLIAAYATLFPEQSLTVLLAFILPVTMRAKYLLYIAAGLALFGMMVPNDNIAHAAHMGGLLTGFAYIRWGIQAEGSWFSWRSLRRAIRPRELVRTSAVRRSLWQANKQMPDENMPTADFISREVDPILDKISAHGIHSLTTRERQILEAARRKMAKR